MDRSRKRAWAGEHKALWPEFTLWHWQGDLRDTPPQRHSLSGGSKSACGLQA
jgi:hypothetical protein